MKHQARHLTIDHLIHSVPANVAATESRFARQVAAGEDVEVAKGQTWFSVFDANDRHPFSRQGKLEIENQTNVGGKRFVSPSRVHR